MKHFSEVTCCVVDFGIFPHVARRLARDFKTVWYTTPWETAEPKIQDAVVGDGYRDIHWVESWADCTNADLFVFPDIGMGALQQHLQSLGYAVWGSGHADALEARRGLFLKTLKRVGLPCPEYDVIQGLDNLRLYLAENPDRFIKVSTYRGDFETLHFNSMERDGIMLDKWALKLGPLKNSIKFYCLHPIDAKVEDGCDTNCVDGVWPNLVIQGLENKDKSLLAQFISFNDLPEPTRLVNEKIGPVLKEYGYRGPFSTEVRITEDGEGFFIDPTCRYGSPPSHVQCEMIANYGEIVWAGANGLTVDPVPVKQYGVQATGSVEPELWDTFPISPELDPWVKIAFSCRIDGNLCVPPEVGGGCRQMWVVGIGDSIAAAIEHLQKNCEQLPDGCDVETKSLAELLATAQEIKFAPKVPDPESVAV